VFSVSAEHSRQPYRSISNCTYTREIRITRLAIAITRAINARNPRSPTPAEKTKYV